MALGKRSLSKPKVYKFVHREDEYIQTNIKGVEYKNDQKGRIYLNTSCYEGYAWDGCTPKFEFLDFLIGTPDGRLDYGTEKPIAYFASMTYDLLLDRAVKVNHLGRMKVSIANQLLKIDSV